MKFIYRLLQQFQDRERMRTDLFDYHLPKELIAQTPASPRDSSRMMILDRNTGKVEHFRFYNMIDLFEEGDVVVYNDTKVVPARLFGKKPTGGNVEILLESMEGDEKAMLNTALPIDSCRWKASVRGRRMKGKRVLLNNMGIDALIEEQVHEGKYLVRFQKRKKEWVKEDTAEADIVTLQTILNRCGVMPTPPYIKLKLDRDSKYQTIFASEPGAIAAPTAGLHFSMDILSGLERRGVILAHITLHVGVGTFRPVKTDDVEDHEMEREYYEVTAECADKVNTCIVEGKRLWVVGTTTMRTLETIYSEHDTLIPSRGNTGIFINPPYKFHTPSSFFLTNFHLPRSTLIMMLSAYCGLDNILNAYRSAVKNRYRFYSFGDAMLIKG